MSTRVRVAGPLLISLLAMANSPTTARAGIPIVYGSGETVSHVTNLTPGHAVLIERPDAAVGYRYYRFHIYWCDLWTSSGEYCLYSGVGYVPLGSDPKLAAVRLGMPEESLHRPLFYLFPFGWVLIGGFVAVSTTWGIIQKRNSPLARAERLLNLPLYQEACQAAGTGPNGFDNAVSFLVGRGLSLEKAQRDMELIGAYSNFISGNYLKLKGSPPAQPEATQGEIPVDL